MKPSLILVLALLLSSCSKKEKLDASGQSPDHLHPFKAYTGSYTGIGQQTLSYRSQDSLGNWYTKHEVSNLSFTAEVYDSIYTDALQYYFSFTPNWLQIDKLMQDSVALDSNLLFEGQFQGTSYAGPISIRHFQDSLWISLLSGNISTACRIEISAVK